MNINELPSGGYCCCVVVHSVVQLLAAASDYTRIYYFSLSLGAKIHKMGIS